MINKINSMSKILKLTGAAFLAILLVACGASSKEEKGSLTDKKSELQKLKSEQNAVNAKVRKLEEEIAKLDTTAVSKTKLVSVTPLAQKEFTHYIDLQGKVDAENISYIAPRGTPGQVKELYIKQGDYVKKGQLILKMEDALARQGVASARQNAEGIKNQS
jgi:multidrug efflux pump subunit AcrA (membrane-fusion protein)